MRFGGHEELAAIEGVLANANPLQQGVQSIFEHLPKKANIAVNIYFDETTILHHRRQQCV